MMGGTSNGLLSLPVELLDIIAVQLDRVSFIALLQTCAKLQRIYEPWVFSRVVLRCLKARNSFAAFTAKAVRLRPFVKFLEISYEQKGRIATSICDDMLVASSFLNLKELKLQINDNGWSLDVKQLLKNTTTSTPFPKLRKLVLRFTSQASYRSLWSIRDFHQLCELPSIKTLRLIGFRFHDLTYGRTRLDSNRKLRVHHLTLESYECDIATLKALLRPLNQLSSLCLSRGYIPREGNHTYLMPLYRKVPRNPAVGRKTITADEFVDGLSVLSQTVKHIDLTDLCIGQPYLPPWMFCHFSALEVLELKSNITITERIELPSQPGHAVVPPNLKKLYMEYPHFNFLLYLGLVYDAVVGEQSRMENVFVETSRSQHMDRIVPLVEDHEAVKMKTEVAPHDDHPSRSSWIWNYEFEFMDRRRDDASVGHE